MSLYQKLRTGLFEALEALKKDGVLPPDISFNNIVLETPRDPAHGDFATNAAMVLAKAAGQSPQNIAANLLPYLQELPAVKQAAVAGPGFINLQVEDAELMGQALAIPQLKNNYGKLELSNGQKALV
jgi:arginyl-tRNA synthetase